MRLFEGDNRSWTSPYIYLVAVLLVAIKLVYGLDGVAKPKPEGLPAAPDWVKWAESALNCQQGPMYPSPSQQVPLLAW